MKTIFILSTIEEHVRRVFIHWKLLLLAIFSFLTAPSMPIWPLFRRWENIIWPISNYLAPFSWNFTSLTKKYWSVDQNPTCPCKIFKMDLSNIYFWTNKLTSNKDLTWISASNIDSCSAGNIDSCSACKTAMMVLVKIFFCNNSLFSWQYWQLFSLQYLQLFSM